MIRIRPTLGSVLINVGIPTVGNVLTIVGLPTIGNFLITVDLSSIIDNWICWANCW